jgi:glutamate 5-kinase
MIEFWSIKIIKAMDIVIKVGTKVVLSDGAMGNVSNEVSELLRAGTRVIIVSSGAVGLGRMKLGMGSKPLTLEEKQAVATVGQVELMKRWQSFFRPYGIEIGQILITYRDISSRESFFNLRNTLRNALSMGIVPIINENDSVAIEEIRFGNNDILGATVSLAIGSDVFLILSDVDGVFIDFGTPNQRLVKEIKDIKDVRRYLKGKGSDFSVGGMKTKIQAGYMCMKSGVKCIIANGFKKDVIKKAISGEEGTIFVPSGDKKNLRASWVIASKKKGKIIIDNGAVNAVLSRKSLLPIGILDVEGKFERGDVVFLTSPDGRNVAIGITNYSSAEIRKIKGNKSSDIGTILNLDEFNEEVVHADNIFLL